MAEYSSFFNSYDGDRKYTAAEFVEYFASFIGNGVFWGGNYCKVNARSGMDVQVEVGKAFMNGYYYSNADTARVLTIEAAHPTMARIDRVVLRLDLSQTGRRITAAVKKGTASNTPVAPSLKRDNAAYELGLADIRVNAGAAAISQSNITDLRLSGEYCGVVAGLINQPDLTNIFNQYQAKYGEIETSWGSWFTGTKAEWNAWFASVKPLFQGWFDQIKAELYSTVNTDFEDWSRRAGYKKVVTFQANGNVSETITNVNNGNVLATRTTVFNADGSLKETLQFNAPALTTARTVLFGANTVTETYE